MMNGMMDGGMMGGDMMWGMGLFGLAVFVLLVLAVAALVKYLFFDGRTERSAVNSGPATTEPAPELPHSPGHKNTGDGSSRPSAEGPKS
tara:strand:- start:5649 stop:5915 length:267 start_codon:yes stop_codon:yes gene_type:complete